MTDNNLQRHIDTIAETEVAVVNVDGKSLEGYTFSHPNSIICLSLKGTIRIEYDSQVADFTADNIAVVLPNHDVTIVNSSSDYEARIIIISNKTDEELKARLMRHRNSGFHLKPNYFLDEKQFKQISTLFDTIEIVSEMSPIGRFNRHDALLYLLEIMIDMLYSYRSDINESNDNSFFAKSYEVFNHFCDLLAHYYNTEHETQFYASKLHMTPKYFSQVIHDTTGISASRWIADYIINKAKRLLATRPDLSIQNIGYKLGFKEQAAFSRFFKNNVGISPKQFREQN